jgi:hypothetical protein
MFDPLGIALRRLRVQSKAEQEPQHDFVPLEPGGNRQT